MPQDNWTEEDLNLVRATLEKAFALEGVSPDMLWGRTSTTSQLIKSYTNVIKRYQDEIRDKLKIMEEYVDKIAELGDNATSDVVKELIAEMERKMEEGWKV